MPGLNINYTKFIREQNEKYIKKYGNDKITVEDNPQPINGYSGHVPTYRGSIYDQKVVRSLVRCLTSPMKPTTANGYRSKSKQFFNPENNDDASEKQETKPPTPPIQDDTKPESPKPKTTVSTISTTRAKSAPAIIDHRASRENSQRPFVSRISMMSAGGSEYIHALSQRPSTSHLSNRSNASQVKPAEVIKMATKVRIQEDGKLYIFGLMLLKIKICKGYRWCNLVYYDAVK